MSWKAVIISSAYLMLLVSVISIFDVKTSPSIEDSQAMEEPLTIVSMFPQEVEVMVGDTFRVFVTVENVTDLYAWQADLLFDPELLECVNVSNPPDYVFSYGNTVCDVLIEYNSTEFKNPLRKIRNDEGSVLVGNCLMGQNHSTFNGSGILCQIEFRAVSSGSSTLRLSTDTLLLDSDLQDMTFSTSIATVFVWPRARRFERPV